MAIISLLVSLAQLAMDIIELLVRLNSSKPLLYKNKRPSWWGKAHVRARCQGRGVGVNRSAAKSLDGGSVRMRRRVWAGRAGELTFP